MNFFSWWRTLAHMVDASFTGSRRRRRGNKARKPIRKRSWLLVEALEDRFAPAAADPHQLYFGQATDTQINPITSANPGDYVLVPLNLQQISNGGGDDMLGGAEIRVSYDPNVLAVPSSISFHGHLTTGSNVITYVDSVAGLASGLPVPQGNGIRPATTISSVDTSDPNDLKVTLAGPGTTNGKATLTTAGGNTATQVLTAGTQQQDFVMMGNLTAGLGYTIVVNVDSSATGTGTISAIFYASDPVDVGNLENDSILSFEFQVKPTANPVASPGTLIDLRAAFNDTISATDVSGPYHTDLYTIVSGSTVYYTISNSYPLTNNTAQSSTPFNDPVSTPDQNDGHMIIMASTSTSVSSSSNSSVYGQSVTFTATVTAGTFDNSGTVTFYDNGSALTPAPVLSGTNTATFTTTATQLSAARTRSRPATAATRTSRPAATACCKR